MLTSAGLSSKTSRRDESKSSRRGGGGKKHGPTSRGALVADSAGPWVHAVPSASRVFQSATVVVGCWGGLNFTCTVPVNERDL